VWKFEFLVSACKNSNNLSVCVKDGDVELKENTGDELKNCCMGINLNGNKHFSKHSYSGKLKVEDTLTVLLDQSTARLE